MGVQEPTLQYLACVPHLNNAACVDYYFICETTGTTLQLQVNDAIVAGFDPGNVRRTRTGSMANFDFVASLQLSQDYLGKTTFAAILIVMVKSNITLTVTCWNELKFAKVSNKDTAVEKSTVIHSADPSGSLVLQFLFSATIVNNTKTYFYMCAVKGLYQGWQTNAQEFGFGQQDVIGKQKIFLSVDGTVSEQHAILITPGPFSLVSLLLVTGIPGVNVTCASLQHERTILFSDVSAKEIILFSNDNTCTAIRDTSTTITEDTTTSGIVTVP